MFFQKILFTHLKKAFILRFVGNKNQGITALLLTKRLFVAGENKKKMSYWQTFQKIKEKEQKENVEQHYCKGQ